MSTRKTPFLTVDVIVHLDNSIVLVERLNPPPGWALPGGFVEVGESCEMAAIREVKEETNLDLLDLKQFKVYSDPKRDPRFHTATVVFSAIGKGTPQAQSDAKNIQLFPENGLPVLAFDHNQILRPSPIFRGRAVIFVS
jgi:ADP-ribose pyrophosphatase YjhB (NUDIX family)